MEITAELLHRKLKFVVQSCQQRMEDPAECLEAGIILLAIYGAENRDLEKVTVSDVGWSDAPAKHAQGGWLHVSPVEDYPHKYPVAFSVRDRKPDSRNTS